MSEEKDKPLGEFLHAKSMLTPGICGSLVMVITNALGSAFDITGPTRSLICLGVSFLAGSLVFAAGVKRFWARIAYYVVNSLIIFSTAAGVNFTGQVATGQTPSGPPLVVTNTLIQTQIVVQVVSNGQTNTHKPKPTQPPVLVTNRVPTSIKAIQTNPKFFEKWR